MNKLYKYRLAPGWIECISKSIPGRPYFYNVYTKCSMWNPPIIKEELEVTNSNESSFENEISSFRNNYQQDENIGSFNEISAYNIQNISNLHDVSANDNDYKDVRASSSVNLNSSLQKRKNSENSNNNDVNISELNNQVSLEILGTSNSQTDISKVDDKKPQESTSFDVDELNFDFIPSDSEDQGINHDAMNESVDSNNPSYIPFTSLQSEILKEYLALQNDFCNDDSSEVSALNNQTGDDKNSESNLNTQCSISTPATVLGTAINDENKMDMSIENPTKLNMSPEKSNKLNTSTTVNKLSTPAKCFIKLDTPPKNSDESNTLTVTNKLSTPPQCSKNVSTPNHSNESNTSTIFNKLNTPVKNLDELIALNKLNIPVKNLSNTPNKLNTPVKNLDESNTPNKLNINSSKLNSSTPSKTLNQTESIKDDCVIPNDNDFLEKSVTVKSETDNVNTYRSTLMSDIVRPVTLNMEKLHSAECDNVEPSLLSPKSSISIKPFTSPNNARKCPCLKEDQITQCTENVNIVNKRKLSTDDTAEAKLSVLENKTENDVVIRRTLFLDDCIPSFEPLPKKREINQTHAKNVINSFRRKLLPFDKRKKSNLTRSSVKFAKNKKINSLDSSKPKRDKFKHYDSSSSSSDENVSSPKQSSFEKEENIKTISDPVTDTNEKLEDFCDDDFNLCISTSNGKNDSEELADILDLTYNDCDDLTKDDDITFTSEKKADTANDVPDNEINQIKSSKFTPWDWNSQNFVDDYSNKLKKNYTKTRGEYDSSSTSYFHRKSHNEDITKKAYDDCSNSSAKLLVNLKKKVDDNSEIISDDIQITRILKNDTEVQFNHTEKSVNLEIMNREKSKSCNQELCDSSKQNFINNRISSTKTITQELKKNILKVLNDLPKENLILVPDTTIYMNHLRFINYLLNFAIPGYGLPVIVVPCVVFEDLNCKKLSGLKESAEARLALLLIENLIQNRHPRLYKDEINQITLNYFVRAGSIERILQSCIRYKEINKTVILLTDNFNLCAKAKSSHVESYAKQDFCAKYILKSAEENTVHQMTKMPPSVEKKMIHGFVNKMKTSLELCLKKIIKTGLGRHFGQNNWKSQINYSNSWNISDLLSCLKFYWSALFRESPYTNFIVKSLNKLNNFFLCELNNATNSLSEVNEIIDCCISLLTIFDEKYSFATHLIHKDLEELKNLLNSTKMKNHLMS